MIGRTKHTVSLKVVSNLTLSFLNFVGGIDILFIQEISNGRIRKVVVVRFSEVYRECKELSSRF